MKAKTWQDTVIRPKSHSESIRCPHCREEFGIEDVILYEREAQAEISFKAGEDKGWAHARQHCEDVIIPQAKLEGRGEVVEWLDKNLYKSNFTNIWEGSDVPVLTILPEKWQAQKKEWGIDEDR